MDIRLANICITVHQRETPESKSYWDGNFLVVTVPYQDAKNNIKGHGPYLHLLELSMFLEACEKLHKTLHGKAILDPWVPCIRIELIGSIYGGVQLQTSFSPDLGFVKQNIEFLDEIDQSNMPDLISSLRQVLDEYPIDVESLATKAIGK